MHWLIKLFLTIVVNALALWAAVVYVPGFVITGNAGAYLTLALILTVLNLFLKPLFKLLLGPLIILTLGVGLIVVNAAILGILDFLSPSLTIETIGALVWATLVIGAVNFILHLVI